MSIIGPRPLLVSYLPWYTEEEKQRHDVRPGLSGLAQVNGRNSVTWEEKFSWDLKYVDRISNGHSSTSRRCTLYTRLHKIRNCNYRITLICNSLDCICRKNR